MKQIIYILTFLILAGCGQANSGQNSNNNLGTLNDQVSNTTSTDENQNEEYRKQALSGFKKATLYKLTDAIIADFNGDGFLDQAFYKKENETSGIIIKHGKTNEEVRIGFGKNFSTWTDFECNWVNYWGLVKDRETSETTFTEDGDVLGSKEVKLQNPSIVLGADEVGGGLITFLNGKYVWIHQTC
jgi:hypothetical protein